MSKMPFTKLTIQPPMLKLTDKGMTWDANVVCVHIDGANAEAGKQFDTMVAAEIRKTLMEHGVTEALVIDDEFIVSAIQHEIELRKDQAIEKGESNV